MDAKLGATARQFGEKFGKRCWQPIVWRIAIADQPGAAVDVPAEHENAVLRIAKGLPHRAEEGRAVDQCGCAVRAFDAPDIAVWAKDCRGHPLLTLSSQIWFSQKNNSEYQPG